MKVDKTKISPSSGVHSTAVISMQQINNLLKSKNISPSSQNEYNSNSSRRSPSIREVNEKLYNEMLNFLFLNRNYSFVGIVFE